MANNSMFSLDGVMKAGTDMMGVASTTFQRAMKVQEVTSTKDENQPGTNRPQHEAGWCELSHLDHVPNPVGVPRMGSAGASHCLAML